MAMTKEAMTKDKNKEKEEVVLLDVASATDATLMDLKSEFEASSVQEVLDKLDRAPAPDQPLVRPFPLNPVQGRTHDYRSRGHSSEPRLQQRQGRRRLRVAMKDGSRAVLSG